MAFASPGVSIKEIDLTPTINVSDQNIGAVVIAAETGPVDTITFVSSEKELVETFGKPNDYNYESWFAASTVIQYGGIVAVVRPTSNNIVLNCASDAGLTNFIIKSKFDFDNYSGTAFKFAGRAAGSLFNSIKVVAVDHGADQVITYSGTDPSVTAGDAIRILNSGTLTTTGWIYKVDTTANTIHIILSDTTKRIPTSGNSTYSITDNAGTPVVLVGAGEISSVTNTYYDTLEYASGLKWRDVAPQPGTSSSVAAKGGKFDEMHILVIDEDGSVTGTPNTILEKYLFVSKAKDATTLDGSLVYFHTAIAERSNYVFPGYSTGIDFISSSKITLEGVTNTSIGETNSSNKVFSPISNSGSPVLGFSLSGGTDYDFANDITDIQAAVTGGYELFRDSETFNDIDFLIPGSINADRVSKLIDIAESRRDCIAVISPRRSDVINSSTSTIKTENIVDFFSNIQSSSFAMFDSGYKYIYDKFNDQYRYVPCAADVAGLCINTTINSETWFSPAGYNRGNLRNATKLAYSPKQSERDRLYTNRINPIVSFPGQGIVLFGDKTALSSPSAFNRINVRRLFIEIEKNIARFSKFQLFEINDEVTRSSFKSTVEPYLRGVQGRRGIYDFLVVCDETNNPSDVIDRNEFNAEIYVKPGRSINYITITFVATRTGISFSELTQ
jgi:DNA/RNA endonuclease YhcR with UshA esterase domain